jgi:hypothetical protein
VLVVVAIITVLLALLVPAFGRARYVGRLTTCASNLRQVGVGAISYASENLRFYPTLGYNPNHPTSTKTGRLRVFDAESTRAGAWGIHFGYDDRKCDWQLPVFQCPQGMREAWWPHESRSASGDRGTHHSGARGFYALYFDVYGGIAGTPMTREEKMRRVGESFITNNSRREFKVLGSDFCRIQGIPHASNRDTGWMTNHIWGGDRNWSWDDPGAAHFSYAPLYYNSTTGMASSNWLMEDAAVVTMPEQDIGARPFWTTAQGQYASTGFNIPTKFAVD